MFSVDFVETLRAHELAAVLPHLPPPGARVLEIGGGTGLQARLLADRGYRMASIDLVSSSYDARRFPVIRYDGARFPFRDAVFDAVFSSNVLEHVLDLPALHAECRRVLRPGGTGVHVMPTATWRLWTSVAHWVEGLQHVASHVRRLRPDRAAKALVLYAIPPRHGERGCALTEMWTFSRRAWLRHFRRHGFEVLTAEPMRLFYTGEMILGPRWAMESRRGAARVLGSACVLYRVRPRGAERESRGPGGRSP